MANGNFAITDLSGIAWECAVESILEIMSRTSFRVLTRRNDWALAQAFALENNIRFDANGKIV